MINSKKNANLGAVALTRTRDLQALIDTLNNTTVGSLANDMAANATAIATLNEHLTLRDSDISENTTAIAINSTAITLLSTKLSSLCTLFGVVFDESGNVVAQEYSTHTHDYADATIADTADGTGVESSTTKTTTGVN